MGAESEREDGDDDDCVLQCVAVCCGLLQCTAVYCRELHCVAAFSLCVGAESERGDSKDDNQGRNLGSFSLE